MRRPAKTGRRPFWTPNDSDPIDLAGLTNLDHWTAPAGGDVMDLRLSVSREAESTVVPVILDLTNLLSADDAGVA